MVIQFKNIQKKYKDTTVINDFTLTINKGELVVFVGPSGCGKTTLLKMINKLEEPTSGKIFINGDDISKIDTIELRRNIGYVIQHNGLFPHMTVKENIELVPKIKGENINSIENKTKELLKLVGLEPDEYMNRYPSELSGGQQQRIGIARALATDADIILMDEPFSALDPITRNNLQEQLFQLHRELNKTIVFVTHDMDEAIKLGDRICLMHSGKILQYDTPDNILKNPANDFVTDFIGKKRIWNNPEFIKAEDIMIREPATTGSNRNVLQAIEIMKTNKVDSLMITDKENKLIGLVTLKRIKTEERNVLLKDVMETNLVTVNKQSNLVDVLKTMNIHSIGYVPVVDDNNQLLGLITRSSVLSALATQIADMEVNF